MTKTSANVKHNDGGMTHDQIASLISICYKRHVEMAKAGNPRQVFPICIEGPPGLGKTALTTQVAKALGIECRVIEVGTLTTEDMGIPWPVDTEDGRKVLQFTIPDWFPRDPESSGLLVFDDRNQCGPNEQRLLANILDTREFRGHKLPDGWYCISTGNRVSDRAGSNRVLTHLRNREVVVNLRFNIDNFINWALKNDVVAELVAFAKFKPDLLNKFDPNADANCTPRSLCKGVGAVVGTIPEACEYEVYRGSIGDGAASELVAFLKVWRELITPDEVLASPDTAPIPEDMSAKYSMMTSLAFKADQSNFDKMMVYVNRIKEKEFSVLFILCAMAKSPSITLTKAFTEWNRKNAHVILGV